MKQEENEDLHKKSKAYAKLHKEKLAKNPDHPIEYIIANAYKKGYSVRAKFDENELHTKELFAKLTSKQRMSILEDYCLSCGKNTELYGVCHCMNDE